MTVHISAGHYPERQGASNGSLTEYALTKRWAKAVHDALYGIVPVKLVPTGNLPSKLRFINADPSAILAVEIHFNANFPRARGSETLVYPGSRKGNEFGTMVQDAFEARGVFQPNRGVKEGWYRMDRPGIEDFPGDVDGDETIDYFLRKTRCTAAIVEPEFISHPKDIEDYEVVGVQCIAEAIREFYAKYSD